MTPLRVATCAGLLLLALVVPAGWWTRPASPDAFYARPQAVPSVAGALLRVEPFSRDLPPGARGFRILYTTTFDETNAPAIASGLVVIGTAAPPGPRPVIAWTHGTTGVVPGCGPSQLAHPFENVPALSGVMTHGWVLVATDYPGLGTAGIHPYLVGQSEARAALDAVRAARRIPGLELDSRVVVWGHSQGGHAALWTGTLAPAYAPELDIAGVAAIAPASDLVALLRHTQNAPIGRILSAYLTRAYAATYDDVSVDAAIRPGARLLAADMARRCLAGPRALVSAVEAALLRSSIFAEDPGDGALGRRLEQNTPRAPIAAPLLIAQGGEDELVSPQIQNAYVQSRCTVGQSLRYAVYADRDHLSIVNGDSPLNGDLLEWTVARLRGTAVGAGCETVRR